ncbi:hypothetical protein BDY24DRAFT_392497 [Mrakia frigida]|uniref:uncharacterized protein n=1 Tax=Mrakia frigida TaxID=29902 RepID=UPI003FCBF74F
MLPSSYSYGQPNQQQSSSSSSVPGALPSSSSSFPTLASFPGSPPRQPVRSYPPLNDPERGGPSRTKELSEISGRGGRGAGGPGEENKTAKGAGRKKGEQVSLACYSCRSRKVKCDSQRPRCSKCTARGDECSYDATMKRRGPDRGKRKAAPSDNAPPSIRPSPYPSGSSQRPPNPPTSSSISRSRTHTESTSPSAPIESYPPPPVSQSASSSSSSSTGRERFSQASNPVDQWNSKPSPSRLPSNAYSSSSASTLRPPQAPEPSFPHPNQPTFHLPNRLPPIVASQVFAQPSTTSLPHPDQRPAVLPISLSPFNPHPLQRISSTSSSKSGPLYPPLGDLGYGNSQTADPSNSSWQPTRPSPPPRSGSVSSLRISDLVDTEPSNQVLYHPPQLPSSFNLGPSGRLPSRSPSTSTSQDRSPALSSTRRSDSFSIATSTQVTEEDMQTADPQLKREDRETNEAWALLRGKGKGKRREAEDEDEGVGVRLPKPSSSSRGRLGLEDLLSPELLPGHVNLPPAAFGFDQAPPSSYLNAPLSPSPFPFPRPSTPVIYQTPSFEYSRDIWFDVLLADLGAAYQSGGGPPLSRDRVRRMMLDELSMLWKVSNHWVSMIHVPSLMAKMLTAEGRRTVQPSLIYILLALAINVCSYDGEGGRGFRGRLIALRLREEAEGLLYSASHGSTEFSEDFAKVAFFIVLFELSSHPLFAAKRRETAIWNLDRFILRLSIDPIAGVRDLELPLFEKGEMPHIPQPPQGYNQPTTPLFDYSSLTLPSRDGAAYAFWGSTPRWADDFTPYGSDIEIRREEIRRLMWNSASMGASLSVWMYNIRRKPFDLFICRPESYAIFFPGELIFYEPGAPRAYARCNVWALQAVTYLLWNYAIALHHADLPQTFKDAKGMEIWEETVKIERLFDASGMRGSQMGLFWQQRDWIMNIRVLVSDQFSRAIPLTPGRSTKEVTKEMCLLYLKQQSDSARNMLAMFRSGGDREDENGTPSLKHRPEHIFWFMLESLRALDIFSSDHTILESLKAIRDAFLPAIAAIAQLFPSHGVNESIKFFLTHFNIVNKKVSDAFAARMPPGMAASAPPMFPPFSVPLPEARSAAECQVLLDEMLRPK